MSETIETHDFEFFVDKGTFEIRMDQHKVNKLLKIFTYGVCSYMVA